MSGDTHVDFTAKMDGHETTVQSNPAFNRVEFRKIDKFQAEVKEKKDGVLVATILDRLSPDAKELTITTSRRKIIRSMSASGREAGAPKLPITVCRGVDAKTLSKTHMRQGLAIKDRGRRSGGCGSQASSAMRADGKDYSLKNSRNDTVSLVLVDAHTVDSIYKRDNQATEKDRWVVSADGQQMTLTTSGMLETGQQISENLAFRRQ